MHTAVTVMSMQAINRHQNNIFILMYGVNSGEHND
jgi:hypothetical protein